MHRESPNFSSELIAAYQAMRPVLLREQRIKFGGLCCLMAAGMSGWAGGFFVHHGGLAVACFIGIFCGGLFRMLARPIEQRWRWMAVSCALAGVVVLNLTWSFVATDGWSHDVLVGSGLLPGGPSIPTRFGFRWPFDLLTLILAGSTAWWFSFRMPTQAEIIQRARQRSHPSP